MYVVLDLEGFTKLLSLASLGRQELQPAGKTEWATTLNYGKILGTTSVVRSIQNLQNVVRCKFTGHDLLQVVFIF